MNKSLHNLKMSSSLIIINALETRSKDLYDYKVILIKRSNKMRTWPGFFNYFSFLFTGLGFKISFLKGLFVFPGNY